MTDEDLEGDRPPTSQHDHEAEQAVLSAVLIDNAAFSVASGLITAEDFFCPAHAVIWEAMLALHERHAPIDDRTLVDQLKALDRINQVGGPTYLTRLLDTIPTIAHVEAHARIVARCARVRRIGWIGGLLAEAAAKPDVDVDDLAATAQKEIEKACKPSGAGDLVALSEDLVAAHARIEGRKERPPGIPTGFPSLDRLTRGLHPGHVWVLAARPGKGKTSFALQLATRAAAHGTVLFFSLEMPRAELVDRVLAAESLTPSQSIARGDLDWTPVVESMNRLWPDAGRFLIDDQAEQTPATIRAKAQAARARGPMALVVVDYLQLVRPGKERENREREVAEVSKAMKVVAKECSCPVLLLSQVNRDIDRRANKTPSLADLRESGAIEADADLVAFLSSEDETDETRKLPRRSVDLCVAKHRHGATAKIPLAFLSECVRFDERAEDEARAPEPKYAPRRRFNGNGNTHHAEES